MKINHLLTLTYILPLIAVANTPEPTSALAYQQTTNTRIVVEENHLRFFIGGAERMTIDSNGNVGVGTVDPKGKLHIIGNHHWLYTSRGTSNGWSQDGFTVEANPDAGYSTLKVHSNHSAVSDRGLLKVTRQSDDLFYIRTDGNVGIGTDTPEARLHLQTENVGIKSSLSNAIIEGQDSQLDIISDAGGTWGSGINLIEGNGTANTDSWSIVRQTSDGNGNSSLRINYGDANSHNNSNMLTVSSAGILGIGTQSPSKGKLHVSRAATTGGWGSITTSNAGIRVQDSGANLYIDGNTLYTTAQMNVGTINGDAFTIGTYGTERVTVLSNGKVGIGYSNPAYKLHVDGTVRATTFSAANPPNWPDFVFEESYELNKLDQVEKYIEENHHLPEIPSAEEVAVNGIDIVDMQAKLLQKIEELTLYVIELKKENENQSARLEQQSSILDKQQKQIEKLKFNYASE